jgi:hypothetical protein
MMVKMWPLVLYVLYAFGFVGLVAIVLIPIRSVQLLHKNHLLWSQSKFGKFAILAVAILVIGAFWLEIEVIAKVFQCLTSDHCGPGRATGWIHLAVLGVYYTASEVISWILFKVARGTVTLPILNSQHNLRPNHESKF